MQIASSSRAPSIPPMIDRVDPAEVGQEVADGALGVLVVAGDQHRRRAGGEARINEVGAADRVERLDHLGAGQGALHALPERVISADRERGRKPGGEIEWVHRVDHDLAAEVVDSGVGDHLLGDIPQQRQYQHLAVRGGLGEGPGFDAGAIARQPLAKLGFAGVTRADHHVVSATVEPARQTLPNLAGTQHAHSNVRYCTARHLCFSRVGEVGPAMDDTEAARPVWQVALPRCIRPTARGPLRPAPARESINDAAPRSAPVERIANVIAQGG